MGVGVNGYIAIAPTPLPSRFLTTSAEGLLGKRQRLPASVRRFYERRLSAVQLSAGDSAGPPSPCVRNDASRGD
jgi:hypothetical protein